MIDKMLNDDEFISFYENFPVVTEHHAADTQRRLIKIQRSRFNDVHTQIIPVL